MAAAAQKHGRFTMHRFSILLSALVVVLLGLGISWGSGTTAQEASPEAASGSIPPLLTQWAEAWSSGDPAQVAALYAEDGVYEEIPTAVVAQGPDEIEAFVADTFAAISNVQVTPRTGFQAEEWAVMEADYTGQSAEGVAFSVPFVVVFELEGDQIVRSADYFDLNSLMTQLAGPAAGATPAA
jgi:steroid delta-isomerase-like uncharacterized protein